MEKYIDTLIGKQQCAFIKGRDIAFNIRKTAEIVALSKRHNKACVIVTIDFEKCFDHVEYKAIRGALKYFKYGHNFIKWLFLLFNNFELCTQNNGYSFEIFKKTCGGNQGCPVSPFIWNHCSELMAHLIYENSSIKGIQINHIEEIMSQFADDMTLFLSYDQETLSAVYDTLA